MALARLARRQQGVVSREQLLTLGGFTGEQVIWRIKHGRLHPVHHNVYAVGHQSLTDHAHLVAALLSAGPAAFLSHRSAAAVWGVRVVNTHEIELTIPGGTHRSHAPLVLHRTRHTPHRDEVRTRTGLRVSSYPRMLIELAARDPPPRPRRIPVRYTDARVEHDLPGILRDLHAFLGIAV
jgi:hypothetical protein